MSVSVAEPSLQIRDTPKVRSILDKTVQLREAPEVLWVRLGELFPPWEAWKHSPSIPLPDLPKSWVITPLLHAAIPPALHTKAPPPLDPWQLQTLIIQHSARHKKGLRALQHPPALSPCPGWSQDWMGTSAEKPCSDPGTGLPSIIPAGIPQPGWKRSKDFHDGAILIST